MIHIRVKLTLPLLLVLGIALLIWLSRDPTSGSARTVPQQPKRPPRTPRRQKPFIIHQDGAPDGDSDRLTYEDALAAGVTGEALREIADREAFDAAKAAYAEALADPSYRDQLTKLRSWRTRHAD
jgi:hypothetical protein